MEIRQVTPALAPALARFFAVLVAAEDDKFFRPHALDADTAKRIAAHQGQDLYYVAVEGEEIVGYGLLRGWDEGFEIPSLGIAVHPKVRGTPLARALMSFLHAAAAAHGAPAVRLRVSPGNRPAVSLYKNLGYKFEAEADLLVGHLDFRPETAWIPWARPVLFGDERRAVVEAVDSTALSDGPFIRKFEQAFSALHGRESLCVSSGTTALHLALLGLGVVGPGDEVILPGWGFAAAANMTIACGAIPVFADVCDDTWLLDPVDVQRLITSRTRAIVATHTYGNMVNMDALAAVAPGVAIIEDCAESLFSTWKGRLAGTMGKIGIYSFQATKTITCGEGGLVLADDQDLLERMRLFRSHGMRSTRKYFHEIPGHNFRLTNLQAAMLCAQFSHRQELSGMRDKVHAGYKARLPGARFQHIPSEVNPVMWAIGIRLEAGHRDAVMQNLLAANIETRPGFPAMSEQPLYRASRLPVSERIASEVLCLPAPADLSEAEIDRICNVLRPMIA